MYVCRALLRDPTLILCDEVTSSVDAFAERDIVRTLRRSILTYIQCVHLLFKNNIYAMHTYCTFINIYIHTYIHTYKHNKYSIKNALVESDCTMMMYVFIHVLYVWMRICAFQNFFG